MHRYLLAAVAAAAIASPAVARDGSPYVGIEGGIIFDAEAKMDLTARQGARVDDLDDAIDVDFKRGPDLDLIAGYDFGMFRAEAELGYKRLKVRDFNFANNFISDAALDDAFERGARATVLSLMGNALVDFGGNDGIGAYVGGGVGAARGKFQGESGTALAWQLLAGVRMPISSNVDLGLKYRFFNSQKLEYSGRFNAGGLGVFDIDARGRLRTHSLLASLIFNLGAPAPDAPVYVPAAPPPPAAPATQICPDGTVILVTDICPAPQPPLPPPPPPPAGERG